MSKLFVTRACAAAAMLALGTATFAQENTANTMNAADPALNATTTDPLATDPANVTTTDPLANDPLATTTTTDPLATDPMMTNTVDEDEDDQDFPWGLLGLLGLAGLLGMKRRDDDVRVDTTRDIR